MNQLVVVLLASRAVDQGPGVVAPDVPIGDSLGLAHVATRLLHKVVGGGDDCNVDAFKRGDVPGEPVFQGTDRGFELIV